MQEPANPQRKPNIDLDEVTYERLKYAREVAQAALDDRRDKAWRIFSWSSSILLAITGGVVAFLGREGFELNLVPEGLVLLGAVFSLSVYACLWIDQNQRLAEKAGEIVRSYDEQLGLDTGYEPKIIVFGYVTTVALLAAAATLATVFVSKH